MPAMARVREVAARNRIEVMENVFHGAESLELRLRRDHHIDCVGFIFGPLEIEFYQRRLDKVGDGIRTKLWFLSRFFKTARNPTQAYRRLGVWSYNDFDKLDLEETIRRELQF